jgi:hypothetical protein
MKKNHFLSFVLLSTILIGCRRHKQSASDFAFITTNMTLQEVVSRVGKYDRVRGSGITHFEYDFPDGSALLISPEWPFEMTNKIRWIKFYRSTNEIGLP